MTLGDIDYHSRPYELSAYDLAILVRKGMLAFFDCPNGTKTQMVLAGKYKYRLPIYKNLAGLRVGLERIADVELQHIAFYGLDIDVWAGYCADAGVVLYWVPE